MKTSAPEMKTIYTKDRPNKKMNVTREFAAPVSLTWQAWTQPEMLDQWWGPKPWRAETKSMDFREGGMWLYSMVGPNNERHWSRADYKEIVPMKYFVGDDYFCDENGVKNPDMGTSTWRVNFQETENGTKVMVEITFPSEQDMQKMIEMGFEEGFRIGHTQLDELLAEKTKK